MFGARSRGLLLFAALGLSMLSAAKAATLGPLGIHREAVDEQSYPWSAIGKLFTEGGGECSGVLISRDKVLTAAHCLFNYRTGRFITADALHFLVGYRTGRYAAHARIARYEIGAGFDPLRYEQTSDADWAVLTVTETLPAAIEPLRLRRELAPSGTKAVLVGYPQDRAFAMTADRDCELREKIDAGRLFLHTCRASRALPARRSWSARAAARCRSPASRSPRLQIDGATKMIAVPAQAIWRQDRDEIRELRPVVGSCRDRLCAAVPTTQPGKARCRWRRSAPDWVSTNRTSFRRSLTAPVVDLTRWLAFEPFAIVIP